jgi:hypothetical protein
MELFFLGHHFFRINNSLQHFVSIVTGPIIFAKWLQTKRLLSALYLLLY